MNREQNSWKYVQQFWKEKHPQGNEKEDKSGSHVHVQKPKIGSLNSKIVVL